MVSKNFISDAVVKRSYLKYMTNFVRVCNSVIETLELFECERGVKLNLHG